MGIIFRRKAVLYVYILSLLAITLLSCSGCTTNLYAGKMPPSFPNTTWKCSDPKISLEVNELGRTEFVIHEEGVVPPEDMEVGFSYGGRMDIYKESTGEMYFRCHCTFYKKKMVAKVTEDNIFDGKYVGKKLVFYRHDD